MNRISETRINWTKLIIALVLLCSISSFSAMAQTDSGNPLDAKSLTALVEELKGVVSRTGLDEKNVALVAEKWDGRKDLAGKTKKDVINLLFEDVKSVIEDSGVQYQIYSIFSLYKLIPDESVSAQTAKTARTALPSDIFAMVGQYSDSLLKNPLIEARLKRLMVNKYGSFIESFETLNPVAREGDFLFSSGCLIHACTHLESAIAVNLTDNTIHAAIFRQNEKTRYFNEGGEVTPKIIRDWANNLRQLNTGANNSESRRSFVSDDVAMSQVETTTPRRLRSPATVRGFIGGESHDGYVVRARKGQVLTVRLSWRSEGYNRASLVVRESPDYYSGEPAKFGSESNDGQRWTGSVPRTGDYYVYVVAHPSAHYTLKVSVR
jgi:hypothetical protein